MSPKILYLAAAAFAASAAALPASAAPGDAPGPQPGNRPVPLRAEIMFNLIDQNGDGAIDATEAATLQKAIFGALDANKDGKLTPDEFKKVADGFMDRHPNAQRFMGRHHGPMGGPGMGRPGFWRNGPGPDGRQGMNDQQQGPGDDQQLGMNDDGGPQPPAPQDAGPGQQPQNFASLDKNGDGVVSLDEFTAGAPVPPAPPAQQP